MKLVIFVVGIKRSGNHALRNWIEPQCPKPLIYRNDCKFDLLGKQYYPIKLFKNGEETKEIIENDEVKSFSSYVAGVEDVDIKDHLEYRNFYKKQLEILGSPRCKCLYIIRNPFNMLASMWKFWPGKIEQITEYASRWVPLAHEFIGKTSFLDESLGEKVISYDEWFVNKNYRKLISNFCEIDFSDEGKNKITSVGSSFDCKDDAEKMKVLERWKILKEDESFINWVKSMPHLIETASTIQEIPDIFL